MALTGTHTPARKNVPTILVVEDELSIVAALREMLEDAGYRVVVAHDGVAAVASVQASKPAAIVLDLGLPKQNGLQFLERLRGDKATFSTPVIVLSNVESSVIMQKCDELGMQCFYVKAHTSVQKVIATVQKTVPLT